MGLFANIQRGQFTGIKDIEPGRVGIFVKDRELVEMTPSRFLIMPGITLEFADGSFLLSSTEISDATYQLLATTAGVEGTWWMEVTGTSPNRIASIRTKQDGITSTVIAFNLTD